MENSTVLLMAELPGLESAKLAIERRINEIKEQLSSEGTYIAPGERPPAAIDPTILGRDVLGRLKRKRHLSPAVIENKRRLIAAARQKKLDNLRNAREESQIKEEDRPAPVGELAAAAGGKSSKRGK